MKDMERRDRIDSEREHSPMKPALDAIPGGHVPPHCRTGGGAHRGAMADGKLTDLEPMCGIVGYVGARPAAPILFDALRRLEYRGYDSSGIAVINGTGKAVVERSAGKLAALVESVGSPDAGGFDGDWGTRAGPPTADPPPATPIPTPTAPASISLSITASSRITVS